MAYKLPRGRFDEYGEDEPQTYAPGPDVNTTLPVGEPAPLADPVADLPPTAPTPFQRASGDLFTGFDLNKQYDKGKSAKGSFLDAISADEAADSRWRSKETAADWFNEYVRPDLEGGGYKVGDAKGDRAFVHTRENPEGTWIDWIRGVQGDAPVFQWLDESYQDQGAPAGGGNGGGGFNIPPELMQALGGGSVMDQIQKELAALVNGSPSPMQRNSLLQQLERG